MVAAERLRRLWTSWRTPVERDETEGHRSMWAYRRALWLKRAALLVLVSVLFYALTDPWHGHNGGTWLGYTLGTVGLALIVWLAWLGIRKRQFTTGRGGLAAWVSAHVYLGLSLAIIATLHAGFQLGFNVHSLAYLLMMLVILSGVYGAIAYTVLPRQLTQNLAGMSRDTIVAEIASADERALSYAAKVDPETHALVIRSVERVQMGGPLWQQIRGRYRRREDGGALTATLSRKAAQIRDRAATAPATRETPGGTRGVTLFMVAGQIFDGGRDARGEHLDKLMEALARRKLLVDRLNRDITLRARQNLWLYLHVPMTFALLVSLVVHVLTVFLYW